jgi:hypothetical protein
MKKTSNKYWEKDKKESIEDYIDRINFNINDEARRCRILLAEILRKLYKNK